MGDVIPFDPAAPPVGTAGAAPLQDVDAFAARAVQEPFWLDVVEIPVSFREALAAAVAEARRDLQPGRPAEIVDALATLADRHQLDLLDQRALELDAEVMAAWPRDLWIRAYRALWERWTWRRMPTVGDFRAHLGDAIEQRRQRYGLLTTLEARLRARAKPRSLPECIAALERAGPGVRQTWFQAAMRRDPSLIPVDRTDLPRWVPVVVPRIARVGILGPTEE